MDKKKTPSKKKAGRPKAAERKVSYTASLKPSDKNWIDKEHGSLTKAIENKILIDKPQNPN